MKDGFSEVENQNKYVILDLKKNYCNLEMYVVNEQWKCLLI